MNNYKHSFSSILSGFIVFACLIFVSIGIISFYEQNNFGGQPELLVILLFIGNFYVSRMFSIIIAKYNHGVASIAWTNFLDKSKKSLKLFAILLCCYIILFALFPSIFGDDDISAAALFLIPFLSIYFSFVHQRFIQLFSRKSQASFPNTPYNPNPFNQNPPKQDQPNSYFKEKILPVLISSTLPVIIAYVLTGNAEISISASLLGTLSVLGLGKNA